MFVYAYLANSSPNHMSWQGSTFTSEKGYRTAGDAVPSYAVINPSPPDKVMPFIFGS